ncbi:hypothetical protein H8K52_02465 [Undibacterium seohonense]|jgi:hypothetical protein|uniref:Uncharacterized protein n=1 Tax=Undibacterium seohonense TaxID=1344950 RepID=A0ABR6WZT7_9BURK|nr:hypothetical protein [Undibacterium seohonense]MBC3806208.1 hypothetical protein [Undibacterium seohonense]
MPVQEPLREFEALIVQTDASAAVFRTTVVARDLVDAKQRLAIQHGHENVLSVWNEEDATKPGD